MISYEQSKKILKKAIIKVKDESIISVNSLNRVTSSNVYSDINYPAEQIMLHLMALLSIQMILKKLVKSYQKNLR